MEVCDICRNEGHIFVGIDHRYPEDGGKSYVVCRKCARKLKRYIRFEQAMNERRVGRG